LTALWRLCICVYALQVAALAGAAISLLRRHLQEPFDLSLLNLGAAGFSESHATTAGTRSIADMLAGAGGSRKGSAAAAERIQQGGGGQNLAGQQQGQRPAGGRAAAAASTQQRRSYRTGNPQAPLLSKRHERQLREGGAQQPAQAEQAQHADCSLAQGDGEEGEGYDMWADLRGLATWRSSSGGSSGTKRSPRAAGFPRDPAGSRVPAAAQQSGPSPHQHSVGNLPAQPVQPPRQQQQQAADLPGRQPARPASYRNAEALAIQQMFAGGRSGGSSSSGLPSVPSAELAPEEQASLELALKLQQEEATAAAVEAAARKRVGPAGQAHAAPGIGRRQKQQGSGPLDAFFATGRGV
jgi:hypothetical protein